MRILYASERPPYPFFLGGAARCAHQLLLRLSRDFGVECAAISASDYAVSPWAFPAAQERAMLGIKSSRRDSHGGFVDCGYPVHVVPDFARALQVFIESFRPDILWSQLDGARPLLELALRHGIRGLYFVHDAEMPTAELRAIGETGCHVIGSSRFLADRAQKAIGRAAQVVYPCPELYFGTRGDPAGVITMINPHRVKGLDTFVDIAKKLPNELFLLVESWKLDEPALADLEQRLRSLPNVRFMRRVSDMRSIYVETKLLLVPSLWEEGFGMVAVEAQSCGIPVVASARGGLPESVGDGGVLIADYRNADAWVEVVRTLLQDPREYGELSARALRHAQSEEFSAARSAHRLLQLCAGPVSRRSAYAQLASAVAGRIEKVPVLSAIRKRWNK